MRNLVAPFTALGLTLALTACSGAERDIPVAPQHSLVTPTAVLVEGPTIPALPSETPISTATFTPIATETPSCVSLNAELATTYNEGADDSLPLCDTDAAYVIDYSTAESFFEAVLSGIGRLTVRDLPNSSVHTLIGRDISDTTNPELSKSQIILDKLAARQQCTLQIVVEYKIDGVNFKQVFSGYYCPELVEAKDHSGVEEIAKNIPSETSATLPIAYYLYQMFLEEFESQLQQPQ